jgi:hypothetical protein
MEHHEDFYGYNLDAARIDAGAYSFEADIIGAGYELEPHVVGVSLLDTPSNPVDTSCRMIHYYGRTEVWVSMPWAKNWTSGLPPFDGWM